MSHKKTSSALIKGLMCLLMAFVCVQGAVAHDFEVDGICYNINSDGNTVTVTYYGSSFVESMFYYSGNVNITSTVQYGGKSYNVTAIGNDAFQMCNMVTNRLNQLPLTTRTRFLIRVPIAMQLLRLLLINSLQGARILQYLIMLPK